MDKSHLDVADGSPLLTLVFVVWFLILLGVYIRAANRKGEAEGKEHRGTNRALALFLFVSAVPIYFDPIPGPHDQMFAMMLMGIFVAVGIAYFVLYYLFALRQALRQWLGQDRPN